MKPKLKKLTWKYFVEQKALEVIGFVAVITLLFFGVFGLPMALGVSIGDGYSKGCGNDWNNVSECDGTETWIEGVLYLIGFAGGIFVLYEWFSLNLRKAKKKAEKELKRK